MLPPDIYSKKAKIIYVVRNPKDLAVSFFHFHNWETNLPTYESWDAFFDDFMSGKGLSHLFFSYYSPLYLCLHSEYHVSFALQTACVVPCKTDQSNQVVFIFVCLFVFSVSLVSSINRPYCL